MERCYWFSFSRNQTRNLAAFKKDTQTRHVLAVSTRSNEHVNTWQSSLISFPPPLHHLENFLFQRVGAGISWSVAGLSFSQNQTTAFAALKTNTKTRHVPPLQIFRKHINT
jgi:hypothetical protein